MFLETGISLMAMKKKNKTTECLCCCISRREQNTKPNAHKMVGGEKIYKTTFYGTFVRRIYFDGNVRKSRRHMWWRLEFTKRMKWRGHREIATYSIKTEQVKMNKKDDERCSYKKKKCFFYPCILGLFFLFCCCCCCWWRIRIKIVCSFFFFIFLIKKETMLFTILIAR